MPLWDVTKPCSHGNVTVYFVTIIHCPCYWYLWPSFSAGEENENYKWCFNTILIFYCLDYSYFIYLKSMPKIYFSFSYFNCWNEMVYKSLANCFVMAIYNFGWLCRRIWLGYRSLIKWLSDRIKYRKNICEYQADLNFSEVLYNAHSKHVFVLALFTFEEYVSFRVSYIILLQ